MEGKTIESRSYRNTDGPENQQLLPHHLADLQSSGLSTQTIESLGFYSATASEVKTILGFDAGPGLVIPYPCYEGRPFSRVKPDNPLIRDGKPLGKYLQAPNSMMRAYIPPKTREALKNPRAMVIITEGEKKAAKADQEGFPTIGLGGIWGFYQHHEFIPDLENIPWKGRRVLLFPDSDFAVNNDVRLAFFTLEQELRMRGAKAEMVFSRPDDKDEKVALDDYLATNGREGLEKLITEAKPCLYWEIDLMVALPEYQRSDSLTALFSKIVRLEPAARLAWKRLCHDKLQLKASDFNLLLKAAEAKLAERTVEARIRQQEFEQAEAKRIVEEERAKLRPQVLKLLTHPALLYLVGKRIEKLGVAGEPVVSRLVYLAVTSRKLRKPLSLTVKGDPSSGKSWTISATLKLFPEEAYLLMSGMSRQALIYMLEEEDFRHRTIVLFEQEGGDSATYNIRVLQSEGKLIYFVTEKDPETGRFRTRKVEKEGPTNFITTTISPFIGEQAETRYWSLLTDDSPQVTRAAKFEVAKDHGPITANAEVDLPIWQQAQMELKPLTVVIPYRNWLVEHTPDQPVRIRRDFGRLLTLIETITHFHQYQRKVEGERVTAALEDYFMARELVANVFAASLTGANLKTMSIVNKVIEIHAAKLVEEQDAEVKPAEVAAALGIERYQVSRWLPAAIRLGLIEVVRESRRGIEAVKPALGPKSPYMLPTVEELAEDFPDLAAGFSAIHPLSGEEVGFEEKIPML